MRHSCRKHVLSVLRDILTERGLPMTQESLSKKVGCSKETIRKIEKDKLDYRPNQSLAGYRQPNASRLMALTWNPRPPAANQKIQIRTLVSLQHVINV